MPDYRPAMASLEVPIMLMTGSLDPKFSEIADELADQNAQIRTQRVDGVGHNLLIEAPSDVVTALEAMAELAQR
jgi:2-succinyl-6-hydroxy-2,4-cyclohexadiene-1-carboxylate synthase